MKNFSGNNMLVFFAVFVSSLMLMATCVARPNQENINLNIMKEDSLVQTKNVLPKTTDDSEPQLFPIIKMFILAIISAIYLIIKMIQGVFDNIANFLEEIIFNMFKIPILIFRAIKFIVECVIESINSKITDFLSQLLCEIFGPILMAIIDFIRGIFGTQKNFYY